MNQDSNSGLISYRKVLATDKNPTLNKVTKKNASTPSGNSLTSVTCR